MRRGDVSRVGRVAFTGNGRRLQTMSDAATRRLGLSDVNRVIVSDSVRLCPIGLGARGIAGGWIERVERICTERTGVVGSAVRFEPAALGL